MLLKDGVIVLFVPTAIDDTNTSMHFCRYSKPTDIYADQSYLYPSPRNWPKDVEDHIVSASPPTNPNKTGAMDFSLWKEIGTQFLVKNTLNNWINCSEDTGSFVNLIEGTISCDVVKRVVEGVCENVVPTHFSIHINNLVLSVDGGNEYFKFTCTISGDPPFVEPCADRGNNYLQGDNAPAGWILLR